MSGEIFDHPCPLVVDSAEHEMPLAEDRKINFFRDGRMTFTPIPPAGACEMGLALATVDQASDPYKRLMATIHGCEGATILPPRGPIKRLLVALGLREPKTECPAALRHVDYSSKRQLTDYFGQRGRCRIE